MRGQLQNQPNQRFQKDLQLDDEDLENERRVLEGRRAGKTYEQIATELGLSNKGQANKIFKRAILRHTADIGPEMRDLEFLRLDDLHNAIWDDAIGGDLKAVETVLRIMERRARLGGLDHTDKMAAAQLKIEADKVRIMALALGRALDALHLDEEQKEQATSIMFQEMKALAIR